MASEPTVCVDPEHADGGQAIAAGLATRAAVEALESKPYIGKAGVVAYLANAIGERAAAPQRSEPVRVSRSRCAAGGTATSPSMSPAPSHRGRRRLRSFLLHCPAPQRPPRQRRTGPAGRARRATMMV